MIHCFSSEFQVAPDRLNDGPGFVSSTHAMKVFQLAEEAALANTRPQDHEYDWVTLPVLRVLSEYQAMQPDVLGRIPEWENQIALFGPSLADLNSFRDFLDNTAESLSTVFYPPGGPLASVDPSVGDWTEVLEVLTDNYCTQFFATIPVPSSVYRAGELVYSSYIDYLSWIFETIDSCALQMRRVTSLITRLLRSGKGLADVIGLFVNERAWYLHHSAHPPACKAVEGRFAATMRRAHFRPLPA